MRKKMKQTKKDTMTSQELAYFFANLAEKPVYAYCAYNNYRLLKIVDIGDCYILLSPEEEGCWMPSSSIKEEKPKPEKVIIAGEDDGPEIA
jgi:hypothetical protein